MFIDTVREKPGLPIVVCNRVNSLLLDYTDNEFLLVKLPLVPLLPVSLSKNSLKPSSSIALLLEVQRMRSAEKDIVATCDKEKF